MKELESVMRAVENVENREKKLCEEYCRFNPQDRERRERDRDLVLVGLMEAKFEIRRVFGEQ